MSIFFDNPALWPQQKQHLDESYASSGEYFGCREAHDAFFSYLITPKSGRWAFASPGKTATSSALDLLFSLEFKNKNSVSLHDPHDLNLDPQTHRCLNHGIFRALRYRSDIISFEDYLQKSVRIATVRHPVDRLWSSFRYLCRSHKESHPMFLADRLKMCALVGFDWDSHPYTKEGLVRFLEYIRLIQVETRGLGLDNHWQPQWMVIRPGFYRPQVIGRAERPDQFVRDLNELLGGQRWVLPEWRNRSKADVSELPCYFADPSIHRLIGKVYEEDFQCFGYDL